MATEEQIPTHLRLRALEKLTRADELVDRLEVIGAKHNSKAALLTADRLSLCANPENMLIGIDLTGEYG